MASARRSVQLARVTRSLVSWWEIPPRSCLERGDTVRFAHAVATLARQLTLAVAGLNEAPVTWAGPWAVAPTEFYRRVEEMLSLADPDGSARLSEELLDEVLELLARAGVEEADERFRSLREAPAPLLELGEAEFLARSLFERARALGARAAVIADSFARGFADTNSDVDIRLFVDATPKLGERRRLVEGFSESRLVRQYGDEAYITSDQFLWRGRKIDVKYHPISWVERAHAESFVLGGPIDLLEAAEVHLPVADPQGVVSSLERRAVERAHRAREIAVASLDALRELARPAERMVAPAEAIATVLGPGLEYFVRAWAGVNGRIHAFPKWLDRLAGGWAVNPPDGWGRLLRLASEPWTRATLAQRLADWRSLVDDLAQLARPRSLG